MKPLTIEELKALPVGEWVWVVDYENHRSKYRQITSIYEEGEYFGGTLFQFTSSRRQKGFSRHSCNYGKTWLAYKNKEMAEGKDDEIRKQAAKEILQHFMGLPTCQHPTIGTGQFMFGKNYIRELAKKYGVEVDE